MSIDEKYGRNRAKFRKVYNYGLSRRPEVKSFVDSLTNTTKSFDFQKIIRDRNYYLVSQYESQTLQTGSNATQYLEVLTAEFAAAESFGVSFPLAFDGSPFVAFELSQSQFLGAGDETPNVSWWVTNITTTGFTANFSAPFTGKILYRAVWASGSYPINVQRTPAFSGSFAWVSAGSTSLAHETGVTMSWGVLPTAPEIVNFNPVGVTSDNQLNVGQSLNFAGTAFGTAELSAPLNGIIHFLVLDTT